MRGRTVRDEEDVAKLMCLYICAKLFFATTGKSNKSANVLATGSGGRLSDVGGSSVKTVNGLTEDVQGMDWDSKLGDEQFDNKICDTLSKGNDIENVVIAMLMELQGEGAGRQDSGDTSYVFNSVCSDVMRNPSALLRANRVAEDQRNRRRRHDQRHCSDNQSQILAQTQMKEPIFEKRYRLGFSCLWNKAVDQTLGPMIESLSSHGW
ncbi:hypothetical protein LOK49_LG15G01626 [Camellia lanceoleosa]|uniref:Uncharacterized protein n=1 Tax=Camellia lanceoleosa TaxID=1840588 RepID=A0ACC0F3L8_9ERIC|nr:hypothetical protein LOK49_LG15G01626 [Camellia lanceoleosa]